MLKTTGAAAGSGLFVRNSVSASADESEEKIGTATFVEVGLEHEGVPDRPTNHIDWFSQYMLQHNEGRLDLLFVDDSTVERFRRQNVIIRGQTLDSVPATAIESDPTKDLQVHLNQRLRQWKSVPLARQYSPPAARLIETKDRTVGLEFGTTQATVPPNTEKAISAPPREVLLRDTVPFENEETEHDGEANETSEPNSSTTYQTGSHTVITVTPIVRCRNHGELDIFDARGGDYQ